MSTTYLHSGSLGFDSVDYDMILVGEMLGLSKLNTPWQSSRDGLSGDKANLSPAKLKLADIGLELSLAKKQTLLVNINQGPVSQHALCSSPALGINFCTRILHEPPCPLGNEVIML